MLRLNHVTFACEDPRRMCEFWAAVLGYEAERGGEDWFARGETELRFAPMPKSPTIELPIHLDINVSDREAAVRRIVGLGAKIVETKTSDAGELHETVTIMRDPEGNGFCVQEPDLRKPHPYVGNITFSAAEPRRVLGPFWAEALGWPEQEIPDDFLRMLRDADIDVDREFYSFYATMSPDGARPRFLFQRREKSRPEHYPIHPDFLTDDPEAEIPRLASLGATVVETKSAGNDRVWTVMRDPEGNPFCIE